MAILELKAARGRLRLSYLPPVLPLGGNLPPGSRRPVTIELSLRCGETRPDDHQAILLQRLGLNLPSHLPLADNKTNEM